MHASLWQPTASLQNLQRRAELVWLIRQFFHERGFVEVQTPTLSHDTVIDRHIDPVRVPASELGLPELTADYLYLQTSPEFCMKRLLAAGMSAIYELKCVFRAGERGQFHNPEFTMLEWYRVGDDFQRGIEVVCELLRHLGSPQPVELISYQAAFAEHVGCDPLACDTRELAHVASQQQLGVSLDWSQDRDDWLNLLFAELVQPRLGAAGPTLVTHYPASQSALAQLSGSDPRTAERYELFIRGIELANGYHELLIADELSSRNQQTLAQRQADGKPPLPAESRLLAAMHAGLPACSGCALGLERLLMVLLEATHISDVLPFPIERA